MTRYARYSGGARLSCSIFLRGDRLDYDYDVKKNVHHAWLAKEGKCLRDATKGEMISFLAPYRDEHPSVKDLVAWLSR